VPGLAATLPPLGRRHSNIARGHEHLKDSAGGRGDFGCWPNFSSEGQATQLSVGGRYPTLSRNQLASAPTPLVPLPAVRQNEDLGAPRRRGAACPDDLVGVRPG